MKINQNSLYLPLDSFSKNQHKQNKIKEKVSFSCSHFFQQLIKFLVGNLEPKICQFQTKTGELIWHIYDPRTGKTEQFISDEDVRIWIEKQYYR